MLIQECAMNRFTFRSILAAFCLFLPCMASALPGPHDPMTGGNGITCEQCHTGTTTIGATTWDNICIICHNGTSTAANGNLVAPFKQVDFADPFGTTPRTGTVYQTSHKWTGTDVQPQAGALAPTDKLQLYPTKGMNKLGLTGSVTCARCHNIHGNSGAQSKVTPYLRSVNSEDQMCSDCHRPRNLPSHTYGTHPVNVNYAAAYNAYTSRYYSTPRNANPANTSSAMKLVSGKILCSTCHGVHYTDSGKSGVEQKASSFTNIAVQNKLSTASGSLLRTNLRAAAIGEVGLCTNCHKAMDHNGSNQQIQCADCHTGHVEYDKNASNAQERLPNLYLLKRYINISTGTRPTVRNKKVLFTSMTSTSYTNASTGVCVACHAAPASHATNGRTTTNCTTSCHTHRGSTSGFSGGCTSCHGYAPSTNTAGGTTGYASDAASGHVYTGGKDESLSGHKSHTTGTITYSCDECHKGNSHNAGTFTDVFISPAGYKASFNSSTPAYAPAGDGTCSSVYCHSNGNPANMKYKNVNWGLAQSTHKIIGTANECVACHNGVIGGFNNMSTNSHFKHVDSTGRNLGCAVCHAATVSSNTVISGPANHVNGSRNVVFGSGMETGTSWNGSTCSTSYCHSNGAGAYSTPTWSDRTTGQCGKCHGTAVDQTLATVTHKTHFTVVGSTDPAVVCVKCHVYTGVSATTHINGSRNDVAGSCAVNSCHAGIANPAWGADTSNNTCTKCHGTGTVGTIDGTNRYVVAPVGGTLSGNGQVSDNVKVGAHQTHLRFLNGFSNYSTIDYRCQGCHGTIPAVGTHADGTSTPVWSNTNVATNHGSRSPSFNPVTGSCSNTYCHNPAGAGGTLTNAGTDVAPLWTNAAYIDNTGKNVANCSKCHGVPDGGTFPNHGTLTTNSSTDCAGCHGHNGDASGAAGQRHIDGIRYANGACDTCHGYPPMTAAQLSARSGLDFENGGLQKYATVGGNHHTTHLLATVKSSEGFTPCLPCHPSTSHNQGGGTVSQANVQVNTSDDMNYRFDESRSKRYNVSTSKCSNISCHFQPTPAW